MKKASESVDVSVNVELAEMSSNSREEELAKKSPALSTTIRYFGFVLQRSPRIKAKRRKRRRRGRKTMLPQCARSRIPRLK